MSQRLAVAAVALAVLVLVASFAVDSDGSAYSAVGPAGARPPPLATDEVALPSRAPVAGLAPATPILTTFTLAWSNGSGLADLLASLENPASTSYRHFLTYPEFVARFGPTPATVRAVEASLRAYGATNLTASSDGAIVHARFTAGALGSMLAVSFVRFNAGPSGSYFTAVGAPQLPASLAGVVIGVGGLSDVATARYSAELTRDLPQLLPASPAARAGTGPTDFVYNASGDVDYFLGSDYAQAYGAVDLWPGTGSVTGATYPTGVAIATLLAGSYNETGKLDLPPFDPAVVHQYFNDTLAPTWPKPVVNGIPVTVAGGPTPPPPGSLGPWNDSSLDEFENSLDLEMAGSLAPGATVDNFYFAGSLLANPATTYSDVADDFATDLSTALAYNYSPEHLGVVSGSFGITDLNDSAWDAELEAAAATGVTVVIASGDTGNAPDSFHSDRPFGQWPVWPASATFNASGAVAVGGVTLSLAGSPTASYNGSGALNVSYDPHVDTVNGTAFTSMSVWYEEGGGQAVGTEGGVSTVYPEPWWQLHSAAQWPIVNATVLESAATIGRAEPDVAMPANNTIVYVLANATGAVYFAVLGGTSVGAPVLAGLLADVVAVESNLAGRFSPLGFIDPTLYRIASFYAAHATLAASTPFFDVTSGANYVFPAGPGWDAATGWGGVIAPKLLAADLNGTIRDYVYSGPTPGLPTSSVSTAGFPWTTFYAVLGAGVAVALGLVIWVSRPRGPRPVPGVPFGAQGPARPASGSGATFACPYCGAERPAEPVRCPRCGLL